MAVVEVLPAVSLDDLAETARREHALVIQSGESMVLHAIRAGEALLAAQAAIPSGQWDQWLIDNFELSSGCLRRYMRMARYRDRIEQAPAETVSAALASLRGAPDARGVDMTARWDAKRLKASGMSIQAVADELEVSQMTVWRWLNPTQDKRRKELDRRRTRAGKRELARRENERALARKGGGVAEAYALVRKALQVLDAAGAAEMDREAKQAISLAISRLHGAEDEIVKASRLT